MTTPTKRLRLAECKAAYLDRTGEKIKNSDIAAKAFKGQRVATAYRLSLLAEWNNGKSLARVTDAAIAGMCAALKCKRTELLGE